MKKNKLPFLIGLIIIIILGITIGIIISINDNKEKLILKCNNDYIKKNEQLTCTLTGNVIAYEVSAFSAMIENNSDFTLDNVEVSTIWEGDGEGGDIDLYTDINKTSKFDILTFQIKLNDPKKEKITINLTNISYFDENFEMHNLENINKTIKVRSS